MRDVGGLLHAGFGGQSADYIHLAHLVALVLGESHGGDCALRHGVCRLSGISEAYARPALAVGIAQGVAKVDGKDCPRVLVLLASQRR